MFSSQGNRVLWVDPETGKSTPYMIVLPLPKSQFSTQENAELMATILNNVLRSKR